MNKYFYIALVNAKSFTRPYLNTSTDHSERAYYFRDFVILDRASDNLM